MQDPVIGDQPLISVCIANFNGLNIIGPCIESVLNQKTRYLYEIIVHDDASTDDSVALIQSEYPQVRLLTSSKNVGYCISNNKMAKHAKGKYLLLLNNDATLFSDALESLVEHSQKIKNPSILGLPQFDMDTKNLIDRGNLFDLFLNPVANKNPEQLQVGMVIGACLWVPKSIWIETGGFPEWFESLAEDMYLCLYAFMLGHDIAMLDKSGYFHKVGHSFGGGKIQQNRLSTTYKRRRLSERNKSYVMILFYPDFLLYLILPIHLFLLLIEGALLALIKRDLKIFTYIYLNALADIWLRKSLLYKKRRSIQKNRGVGYYKFLSVFMYFPYKLKMLLTHGLPSLR